MTRKKIVLTGASKGIGKAIAVKFAAENWDVAVCSRNEENLSDLIKSYEKVEGSDHIVYACDVSEENELKGFVDTIQKNWGQVDVLVNNAGVFFPGGLMEEEEGALRQMLDTNLMSTYLMCRWLVPAMISRKKGLVVNVCSTASKSAYANGGSYSISKYAQYGLTRNLREELKDTGVGVTALLPGPTFTDSWKGSGLPEDRFVDPGDIAELVFNLTNMHPQSLVEELTIRPQLGDIN